MIYERPRNDGAGVTGPETGFFDVVAAAFDQSRTVDSPLSGKRRSSLFSGFSSGPLEEAYDRRNAAIFSATGQQLPNPARQAQPGLPDTTDVEQDFDTSRFSRQQRFRRHDPYEAYDAQLRTLAEQHPDHAAVIAADRSPRLDAQERVRRSEHAADDVLSRYDGPAGTGTLASLIGGAGGSLTDPANLLGMAVGPMGTVGAGARAIAWNALKTGAANATVEAGFQPLIADWRREAGLDYDISHFAMNVGGAAALGFGLDAGIRSGIRGVQRYRGMVPKLDAKGGFTGWQTPDQALEAAAVKSAIADVAQSSSGDPAAMRRLAAAMGRDGDPDIMRAIDRFEAELQTSPRHASLDPDDTDARFAQAVRSVLDEREPPPARAEPLPERRLDVEPTPERDAAMRLIDEGDGSPVEIALALRAHPDLAAGASFASARMQVGRALSQLSDEALAMVLDGTATPQHAALVGQHVPDRMRQASVLNALEHAQPESLESARHMIAELTPPAERGARADRLDGLDDPAGPEAKAQTEALDALLADRIETAKLRLEADGKAGREIDALDKALLDDIEAAERLIAMSELIAECKL